MRTQFCGYKTKRNMTGSYGSLSSDSEELLGWSLASAVVQNPNPRWKEFHFPNVLTNIYFRLGFWWWLSWFGMEWIFSAVWNYISLMVTSFFVFDSPYWSIQVSAALSDQYGMFFPSFRIKSDLYHSDSSSPLHIVENSLSSHQELR